jgi:hypothetical protein
MKGSMTYIWVTCFVLEESLATKTHPVVLAELSSFLCLYNNTLSTELTTRSCRMQELCFESILKKIEETDVSFGFMCNVIFIRTVRTNIKPAKKFNKKKLS